MLLVLLCGGEEVLPLSAAFGCCGGGPWGSGALLQDVAEVEIVGLLCEGFNSHRLAFWYVGHGHSTLKPRS